MKKLLTLITIVSLIFGMTFQTFKVPAAAEDCKVTAVRNISDRTAKAYYRILYGNDSFFNNQYQTLKTLSKIDDNTYLLNYTYDYDIDDALNTGVSSIADLLVYCGQHLLNGKGSFSLDIKELGCSGFTCNNESGDQIMGRNFDYKDAPCLILWTSPANGYKSVSMVDTNMMLYGDIIQPGALNRTQLLIAPYITLDGINEAGLSIGVLQVKADGTAQDTGKNDTVTTVAIRAILDKCATCDEAVALLSQYDMHDILNSCSYHYLISDATGRSIVVEYINNELRVIENDPGIVTNFFLSEDGVEDTAEGLERYATMEAKLAENNGTLTETGAMQLLNSVHLNYQHKKYPWKVKTLWSAVFNNTQKTLSVCTRMNYGTIYKMNPAVPFAITITGESAEITDYTQAPN